MRRTVLSVALAAVVVAVLAGAVSAFLASGSSEGMHAPVATPALPTAEIVFTRQLKKPDRSDLYVMAADGSHLRLLVRDAAEAAASFDGRRIAFARGGAIWIVQRNGARPRLLTQPRALPTKQGERPVVGISDPAWSPGGRTLYFVGRDRYHEVFSTFSIRSDGTHLTRLAQGGGGSYGFSLGHLSPSPDGLVIAYSVLFDAMHYAEGHIVAVFPTGRPAQLPFAFPGHDEDVSSEPTWSPDGRQMAYTFEDIDLWGGADEGPDPSGLYVSRSDGSRPLLIVGNAWFGQRGDPAWSPDGEWIAFWGRRGIALVRPDGTGPRALGREGYDPAWLPAIP